MNKFNPLTTERLILRDFTPADLATFAAYRSDENVARYQSWEDYDLTMAQDFFNQQQALTFNTPDTWYQIAIADSNNNQLVGDCVIHFLAGDEQAPAIQVEIGFTLATEHQGKGYGVEAIGALVAFIFNDLAVHRITAVTDVLNEGSIHLLEKLAFRREAHHVNNIWFKGGWGSEYVYARLRGD